MANELKKIIREAFTIAYSIKKSKQLKESVDSLKSKMSSGDVNKVENIFRAITTNPNLAAEYAWTPQGSANGELNQKQFNLLTEMIFEQTNMETKRNLIMSLYNQNNQALFNKAAKRIMATLKTPVNQKTMEQAYMDGWEQMFLDSQNKKGDIKQNFADIAAKYSSTPIMTKSGELRDSNFGAYIAEILTSNMLNAYKNEMSREGSDVSLDQPSSTTGKPVQFGSDEDFGSDTQHSTMSSDDLSGLGAGLENPEELETGEEGENDEYVSAAGDEEEGGEESFNSDDTIGANVIDNDSTPAEREARKMIRILVLSIKQAIKEYRGMEDEATPPEIQAMDALEYILKTGAKPKEASAALGFDVNPIIDNLKKKSKDFVRIVDYYLFTNGFLGPRGKPVSFANIKPMYLSQMVKYMNTGDVKHLSPELTESKIWFIDNLMLENFIENNLEKVMENVYKKLKNLL